MAVAHPRPAGWIGRSRKRVEDQRLISGQGLYVDDVRLPGTLSLAMVRSPYPHARIKGVQLAAARSLPGVVDAIDGRETAHLEYFTRNNLVEGTKWPPFLPLTIDKARYAGDGVAAVLAETRYQAEDAARLVEVEYEPLPAVTEPEAALAGGARLLHDAFGTNGAYEASYGSAPEDWDAAFALAEHVVSLRIEHNRLAPVAIEPRGALFSYDPTERRLDAWISTQRPHPNREELARVFQLDPDRVRVICQDVGGAFGSKSVIYREYIVAAYLSIKHGRPVRFIATRSEDFQACSAGRGLVSYVEAGFKKDGELLAIRSRVFGDLGAYMAGSTSLTPSRAGRLICGAYRVRHARSEVVGVFTNKAPAGPYRGAGRPEGALTIERVMDVAAHQLGIDPVAIRRRNFIRPDEFPWTTPFGLTYDSGDYERTLDHALALGDYAGLLQERSEARARGELHGIGLSTFIEPSGGGFEVGSVRVEADGSVTAATGSASHGQGHVTTWAQILADRLSVPIERITVLENDTAVTPPGIGTMGSRSTYLGGGAMARAADAVLDKMKRLVGHALEVDPADLVMDDGSFHPAGDPAHALPWSEVAAMAYQPDRLPPGEEVGLAVTDRFQAPSEAWGHGTHLVALSVDRGTGAIRIRKLLAVDDAGVVINPLLAEGQIAGGLAQGVAQALFEEMAYDPESGAVLTGTMMDYEIPTARDLPPFQLGETETPSPLNPLGVKGLGEAGTVGIPAAVVNAVVDALWDEYGVTQLNMPLTPAKMWSILNGGAGAAKMVEAGSG